MVFVSAILFLVVYHARVLEGVAWIETACVSGLNFEHNCLAQRIDFWQSILRMDVWLPGFLRGEAFTERNAWWAFWFCSEINLYEVEIEPIRKALARTAGTGYSN